MHLTKIDDIRNKMQTVLCFKIKSLIKNIPTMKTVGLVGFSG